MVTWRAKSDATHSWINLIESEKKTGTKLTISEKHLLLQDRCTTSLSSPILHTSNTNFSIFHLQSEIPKISSIKLVQIESEMMGGGRMAKKSS